MISDGVSLKVVVRTQSDADTVVHLRLKIDPEYHEEGGEEVELPVVRQPDLPQSGDVVWVPTPVGDGYTEEWWPMPLTVNFREWGIDAGLWLHDVILEPIVCDGIDMQAEVVRGMRDWGFRPEDDGTAAEVGGA
jgi:hypothetical protein